MLEAKNSGNGEDSSSEDDTTDSDETSEDEKDASLAGNKQDTCEEEKNDTALPSITQSTKSSRTGKKPLIEELN